MKTFIRIIALIVLFAGLNTTAKATNAYDYQQVGDSIIVNFGEGGKMVIYLKDTNDLDELKSIDLNDLVQRMSVYVDSAKKSEDGTYTITNEMGEFRIIVEEVNEDDDDGVSISIGNGKGLVINGERVSVKRNRSRTESYTDLYLGLNGYVENGEIPNGTLYDLRPLGSRFFEISFKNETRIGGKKSNFYINYAVAFSWYNFMFEGNRQVDRVNGQVIFSENMTNNLDKSKLTASYIKIPAMLTFKTNDFRIAAGGYVGYRLGSHSKVKFTNNEGDTVKDKDFGNFNLTNFRYGLQAEIGVKSVTLFGQYDLNELFTSDSGAPKLNAFAFGIRL